MDLLFHTSVFSVFKHIPLQVSTHFVHISVDMDRHVMTFASINRFGLCDMEKTRFKNTGGGRKWNRLERSSPQTAGRLSVASV